ncbi:hypothetical protein SLW73_03615 [Glutamicibacter protophormiae]|uniref:hypothetical protein n=1 Tax=Glutamicibacter protophormiae TaxID=37930 RepID=UPI002A800C32|nr:hypothetical protein [Glutamicibacter protophormiae]WPR65425.1 hypothetical protein SLW72_03615 [Glutamicibacter protophormiae]WPR68923.1 hypothetical protein SLW73_03615 [Glutamicibacter protophormiae]
MSTEPTDPIQSPADAIHWCALSNDLLFGTSVAYDFAKVDRRIAATVVEGFYRYLALYVVEGTRMLRQWGEAAEEIIDATPIDDAQTKRARLSIKILEGNSRTRLTKIDRLMAKLDSEPIVQRFSPDMYLDIYKGRIIGTSHSTHASFGSRTTAPGIGWENIRADSEALGQRIAGLGKSLLVKHDEARNLNSCVTGLKSRDLERRPKSSYFFYRQRFRSVPGYGLRGVLIECQSIINFAHLVLGIERHPATQESALKLQFLSLYGVATVLRQVRRDEHAKLTRNAALILDELLNSEAIQLLTASYPTDQPARILRNTLTHYGSQNGMDESKLDFNKMLYGYVESTYRGSLTGPEFQHMLVRELARFSDAFEEWALLSESD